MESDLRSVVGVPGDPHPRGTSWDPQRKGPWGPLTGGVHGGPLSPRMLCTYSDALGDPHPLGCPSDLKGVPRILTHRLPWGSSPPRLPWGTCTYRGSQGTGTAEDALGTPFPRPALGDSSPQGPPPTRVPQGDPSPMGCPSELLCRGHTRGPLSPGCFRDPCPQ